MTYKSKFKNKSNSELINHITGCTMQIGCLKNLLTEYKATILIQGKQIELLKKKLKFLEEKRRYSINYKNLGKNTRRDIGTQKRAWKKRSKMGG